MVANIISLLIMIITVVSLFMWKHQYFQTTASNKVAELLGMLQVLKASLFQFRAPRLSPSDDQKKIIFLKEDIDSILKQHIEINQFLISCKYWFQENFFNIYQENINKEVIRKIHKNFLLYQMSIIDKKKYSLGDKINDSAFKAVKEVYDKCVSNQEKAEKVIFLDISGDLKENEYYILDNEEDEFSNEIHFHFNFLEEKLEKYLVKPFRWKNFLNNLFC